MHFAFSDDQRMLRDTVREVLQRECPAAVVRAAWEQRDEPAGSVWSTLAETGVVGMLAPEAFGGMGMSMLDSVLVFEELGYAAFPGPIIETVTAGIPLLAAAGTQAQRNQWLAEAATGQAKVVVSFDGRTIVPHVGAADLLLFEHDGQAFCIRTSEMEIVPEISVDRARALGRFALDPTRSEPMRDDVDARSLFRNAKERATVATAAMLIGLTRRMLDMAVDYAKAREQFGKPIGAQQAVKHRLANALIDLEFARPMVYRAAWSLSTSQPTLEVDVSAAKVLASAAARRVAQEALQVHGAIGYTTEYDLHLWMKRAWSLAAAYGDETFHKARLGHSILP